MKKLLLPLLFLFPQTSFAIDPFQIASVGASIYTGGMGVAAMGAVSSIAGIFGSSADTLAANELDNLFSVISGDQPNDDHSQRLIDNVNQVNQMVSQLGYDVNDIAALGDQSGYYNGLADQIRRVTTAVKAAKDILKTVSSLQSKASASAIETKNVQEQELSTLNAILVEEQTQNLEKVKSELQVAVDKQTQIRDLQSKMAKNGVKAYQRSRMITFPQSSAILGSAIDTSTRLKAPMFALIILLFALRVLYFQVRLDEGMGYVHLFKDTCLCIVLLTSYPQLLQMIFAGSDNLAAYISSCLGSNHYSIIDPNKFSTPSDLGKPWWLSINLQWVFEWFVYLAYLLSKFIMSFGMSFFVLFLPIVMTLSIMTGFALGWDVYLGLIIGMSLWPVAWNLLGISAELIWSSSADPLECAFFGFFMTLCQIISPFLVVRLFKGGHSNPISDSMNAIRSTHHGMQSFKTSLSSAVKSTMQGLTGIASSSASQQKSQSKTNTRPAPLKLASTTVRGNKS